MVTNVFLAIMVVCALVLDLKTLTIPNYITFTGAIFGLILHIATRGLYGLFGGLFGMVVGISLLFIPFAMRGIGGGDVKLLGAIGAFKGMHFAFSSFLASSIFGGFIAIIIIAYKGKLIETLKWCFKALYKIIMVWFTKGRIVIQLDNFPVKDIKYPYGLAISLGTFVILALEVMK